MSKYQVLRNMAKRVAVGIVTIDEAKEVFPHCRFEILPNGRCFWFDYQTKMQGSEA